jgi:hypothetical protein
VKYVTCSVIKEPQKRTKLRPQLLFCGRTTKMDCRAGDYFCYLDVLSVLVEAMSHAYN